MAAKPLRTMLNRASAERCLRSLGATSAMVTPTARPHIVSVRGVLLHRCLRKDNPERPLFTGLYPSPGIVVKSMSFFLQIEGKHPFHPQEEEAHGRQNYRDVLPL